MQCMVFFIIFIFISHLFEFASISCLKNVDWLNDDDVLVLFLVLSVIQAQWTLEKKSHHCCRTHIPSWYPHIIGAGRLKNKQLSIDVSAKLITLAYTFFCIPLFFPPISFLSFFLINIAYFLYGTVCNTLLRIYSYTYIDIVSLQRTVSPFERMGRR